jgi:diguanylate cyclase (GGDEF)-like protein
MSITPNGEPGRVVDIAEFVTAAEAATGERMVAVAVSDFDGLAAFHEAHGVEATKSVLAGWQRTLTASLPDDAVVARISGDEWAVAMPGASAESALIILEEIRTHYTEHGIGGVDAQPGVSIGIAARPPHAASIEDATRAAVEALMRAKREGPGRIAIYVEEKMTLKSNYYSRASLDRLGKLASTTQRTEASLLREALDDLLQKHRDRL